MIHVTCPRCGRRLRGQSINDWPQFPFCSEKCKLIDLGRWLSGANNLPAEEPEEAAEEEESDNS